MKCPNCGNSMFRLLPRDVVTIYVKVKEKEVPVEIVSRLLRGKCPNGSGCGKVVCKTSFD